MCWRFSGCGGDDEELRVRRHNARRDGGHRDPAAPTETEQEAPEAETETESPAESPEDEPGGAGDEEPARTLALFTAENGRITPRVVRVPAFISIQVELRSKDGREYGCASAT